MCGRYRLSRRKQMIQEYFDTTHEVDWKPRYNVAPSQQVGIIRQDQTKPERHFSIARWGLISFWAKDASVCASYCAHTMPKDETPDEVRRRFLSAVQKC